MAWYDRYLGRRKQPKSVKLFKSRSYKGASSGRLFSDFLSSSSSADQELRNSLVTLRNRSRELSRNNGHVARYLNLLSTNVIGNNGVRINCKARDADGSLDVIGNQNVHYYTS